MPSTAKLTTSSIQSLKKLDSGTVKLPASPGGELIDFTMKEMGVYLPILANDGREVQVSVPDPDYVPSKADEAAASSGPNWARGSGGTGNYRVGFKGVPAFEFTIQFIWIENTVTDRLEARAAAADESTTTDNDDA